MHTAHSCLLFWNCLPALQDLHFTSGSLFTFWYLPSDQSAHAVSGAWNSDPAGQNAQSYEVAAVRGWTLPCGQSEHAFAWEFKAYFPLAHVLHPLSVF